MNKQIALILLDRLQGAPYLEHTSGIVQQVRRHRKTEEVMSVDEVFPFSSFATPSETGKMNMAMVPDSKKKSLLYFEDGGIRVMGVSSRGIQYRSSIRLVCWFNTAMINADNDKLMSQKIMGDVIAKITTPRNVSEEPFLLLNASVSQIPAQNSSIFTPFTYDETKTQYLLLPYDFFAIDFEVDFVFSSRCMIPVVVGEPAKCGPDVTGKSLSTENDMSILTEDNQTIS